MSVDLQAMDVTQNGAGLRDGWDARCHRNPEQTRNE